MSNSVEMDFELPIPGTTPDITASQMIVDALEVIDGHDHETTGKKVPVGGINWNSDIDLDSKQILDVGSIQLESKLSVLTGLTNSNKVIVVNGDLYFVDGDARAVRMTNAGSINVSSVGGISGMGEGVDASVIYFKSEVDPLDIGDFAFSGLNGKAADISSAGVIFQSIINSSAVSLRTSDAMTTGYNLTLPSSQPLNQQLLRCSTGGSLEPITVRGTTNQVSVAHETGYITLSLPETVATTTVNATIGNITTVNATTVNATTVNSTTTTANIINENSAGSGVTIDGLLIKDGGITSPSLITPALGTPTSGNIINCLGLPIVGGTTGTLSVARGGTGVTTSTGSGNVMLSTSPTISSPRIKGVFPIESDGSVNILHRSRGNILGSTYIYNSGSSAASGDGYFTRIGGVLSFNGHFRATTNSSGYIDVLINLSTYCFSSYTFPSSLIIYGCVSSRPDSVTTATPPLSCSVESGTSGTTYARIKCEAHYGASYTYVHTYTIGYSFSCMVG